MERLDVTAFDGIGDEIQSVLFEAMKTCSNAQRLCVCLFLMSDLPDYLHSLDKIEEDLSKIFPPSIPHGNTPDTYKDFAATAIRQYFNYETGSVRDGEIRKEERLWHNPQRGHWRNTDIGNAYAMRVLKERKIEILKQGNPPEAMASNVDYSKRRYLDEQRASESLGARQVKPEIALGESAPHAELKNLTEIKPDKEGGEIDNETLGEILRLLSHLSSSRATPPTPTNQTTLNMTGSPSLILQLLAGQQASNINIFEFHLSQKSGNWQVDIILSA